MISNSLVTKISSDVYFSMLCDIINLDYHLYSQLIYELYSIDFFSVIELDSNREYDGLVLRGEYFNSLNELDELALQSKPCSVLEALIGLSKCMNVLLDDDDRGDRTRIWFWEFISNLGLDKYTDAYMDDCYGRGLSKTNDIRKICNTWMSRKFNYDGRGSPFPLKNPYEDQRNLDMIRQLNAYVLENYVVNDEPM